MKKERFLISMIFICFLVFYFVTLNVAYAEIIAIKAGKPVDPRGGQLQITRSSLLKTQAIRWGGLIHDLRTFLRQASIAPLIQELTRLT